MMPAARMAASSRPRVSVVAGRMSSSYRRMLTGTVTPPQVKRALLVDHTPAEATAALATLVQTRAAGGRALRKNIRLQTVRSTGGGQAGGGRAGGVRAGGVAEARALIELALQAEPGRGAGPAARSLLRARLGGQLPMDQYGAAALGAFFHGNGYTAPGMAARRARPPPCSLARA